MHVRDTCSSLYCVIFQARAAVGARVLRRRPELHGPPQPTTLLVRQLHPEPVHSHRFCAASLSLILLL